MTRPSIVLCVPGFKPEAWVNELQELLPDARLTVSDGASTDAPDADYGVVWMPPDPFYALHPRLKTVFNLGAGVDGLLRSEALPKDIPIVRLEDAGMAPLMAEYVLQAALRFSRKLDAMETQSRAGRWSLQPPKPRSEYPVGILGAGALGEKVAVSLRDHDFDVAVWSRTQKTIAGVGSFAGPDALDAFLARTRILVCLLPLTADTEDFIDHDLLAKLMPEGYLINVGRGRHLVDDDLLAAIAEGRLAGATLDVFRREPLPADHPFWQEPRITITPHCSAMTQRAATLAQIADKIGRLERGEPITGVVDRSRGY